MTRFSRRINFESLLLLAMITMLSIVVFTSYQVGRYFIDL